MRLILVILGLSFATTAWAERPTVLPPGQIGVIEPFVLGDNWPPASIVRGNGMNPRVLATATRPEGWQLRSDAERKKNVPCPRGYQTAWVQFDHGGSIGKVWYPNGVCVRSALIPQAHPPR
jgi:hypothetical protein